MPPQSGPGDEVPVGELYAVLARITHDQAADPNVDPETRAEAADVARQATDAALRHRGAR